MRLPVISAQVFFMIVVFLYAGTASADVVLHRSDNNHDYDFVRNGLNYKIKRTRTSDGTSVETDSVCVISGNPNTGGVLDIPNYVDFSGKRFIVYDISDTFKGCESIKQIILPSTIAKIGYQAFEDCKNLEEITFSEGLVALGHRAFAGCIRLKSISLPASLTILESYAFYNCKSLKQVIIPKNVSEIQILAFGECSSLEEVTFGKNLRRLNGAPFSKCKKLKSITCLSPIPPAGSAIWGESKDFRNVTLHVPATSIEIYRTNKDWRDFGKILPLLP